MPSTAFSNFAIKLATHYKKGLSAADFVKELFSVMYIEDGTYPLDNVLPRTYKSYYLGQSDIGTVAVLIAGSLDKDTFAEWLQLDSDSAKEKICNEFSLECPNITVDNYENELSDLFEKIIIDAAKPKKRKKQNNNDEVKLNLDTLYGASLISEEDSVCPCDGCAKPLFIRSGNKLTPNYKVVIIDDSKPANTIDNLLAVCPECAVKINLNKTRDTVQRLVEIKERIIQLAKIKEMVADEKVELGIKNVLKKITNSEKPPKLELTYTPAAIKNKIQEDEYLLFLKIRSYVDLYYMIVHDIFQQLDKEGIIRFDIFCLHVKANYLKLANENLSQHEIFDNLVTWLQNATNEDRQSCEVVIAYFVQKCEVFYDLTK